VTDETRHQALEAFGQLTGVTGISRLVQRGRDPQTARFTLELDDGREVRIGTIDNLWSQTQLAKVVAVTMSSVLMPCEAKDWRIAIGALIVHATDVEETPGETLEDAVADWLERYAGNATTDSDGAAATGAPFIEDGHLHVNASDLAKYIRREYTEQIKLHDIRQALADLGYERRAVNYVRGTGNNAKRSSTSYYRTLLDDGSGQ
jgi:hypothetical protein